MLLVKRMAVLLRLDTPRGCSRWGHQHKSQLHLGQHLPTVCAMKWWEAEDPPEVLLLVLKALLCHSHYSVQYFMFKKSQSGPTGRRPTRALGPTQVLLHPLLLLTLASHPQYQHMWHQRLFTEQLLMLPASYRFDCIHVR